MRISFALPMAVLALACTGASMAETGGSAVTVVPAAPVAVAPLPVVVTGRVARGGTRTSPIYERQWPGGYVETAFTGTGAYLRVGEGDVILHIVVDDRPAVPLVRPRAGFYRIGGLAPGRHRVRVQIVSESQAGPTSIMGIYPAGGTTPLPLAPRARQIEFIGDSHTVGYGNTAPTRTCSPDQVWATTDTAQGIAGQAARRYRADYQVNAISGRGIVRNYDGGAGDTLPRAYPFVLFDKATRYADPAWRPQVIVVALGTNDFSTPLHAGEPWRDREALHADYEATYTAFVRSLRARNPRAHLILWATDLADGEIAAETARVVARLRAQGERRIDFVPVGTLAFSACDAHPSVADDRIIADAIGRAIDAHPAIWQGR